MHKQKKASYNLLRLQILNNLVEKYEKWQVEDFRLLDDKILFQRLKDFGLILDNYTFLQYSEKIDSPEELAKILMPKDISEALYDQCYLYLFELWRRVVLDKRCISIFCDELDFRISLYKNHALESDELIQDILVELEKILEENVEAGNDRSTLFILLSSYCAYDLDQFLYDYIQEQIEAKNFVYAAELIEVFSSYLSDSRWFKVLQVKLLILTNVYEANCLIKKLVVMLEERPSLLLQLELLRSMTQAGNRDLFVQLVHNSLGLIHKEEQFQALLKIVLQFYSCIDKEETEQAILQIIAKRAHLQREEKIDLKEKDFQVFSKLLV